MTDALENLTFVRLKLPHLIPESLIEHVKGRTFTSREFYEYQIQNIENPHNHLFALIDEDHKINGFLWAQERSLDRSLFINTFSIEKELWREGDAIGKATELIDSLKFLLKSSNVFWITTNDRYFKKKGFKRSKNVLMEYN